MTATTIAQALRGLTAHASLATLIGMNALVGNAPIDDIATKIALSLAIGLLVGIEREWAGKVTGVRTLTITSLLGALSTLAGSELAHTSFFGVFLLVTLLNAQSLWTTRALELTTSAAMMLLFVLGALVGAGHYFTGATGAILLTMLLAWKVEMARFAVQLQPKEIRGAVLLGLLTFVIYPLLPNRTIDPLDLLNPRQAWMNVVVLAGIGFVNYIILRMYSARGLLYAALLGGLVNSSIVVVELAALLASSNKPLDARAERLLFVPNVAMFVRNLLLLALLCPPAASHALVPLAAMAAAAGVIALGDRRVKTPAPQGLRLPSPVAVRRLIKTGLLFIALATMSTLGQRYFGSWGFLAISIIGGAVSSASAAATAASLAASGAVTPPMAAMAATFAAISSALANLPLIYDETRDVRLLRRLTAYTFFVSMIGLFALLANEHLARSG